MTEENNKVSKAVGSLAGKMLNLVQKGAKKLEDYAEKSAVENNNENAKKLAGVMSKFSQNLESKQENYVAGVEKNTEDLIKISKKTFGKVKQVYSEMKTRAEVAKDKAEQDAKPQKELAEKKTDTIEAENNTTQAEEDKKA